ncbi:MAG: hypothetical protein DDT20_00505 [Firmicutes bacterium]|nr:hypothetical protein [Bacillota bacterium]
MLGLPVGLIALVIVTILILSGVAQRVLDRMKMNGRTALMLVLAMLVGGFLPDLPLAPTLSINVGGGLIPIGKLVPLCHGGDCQRALAYRAGDYRHHVSHLLGFRLLAYGKTHAA